jgi:hypothetical protein
MEDDFEPGSCTSPTVSASSSSTSTGVPSKPAGKQTKLTGDQLRFALKALRDNQTETGDVILVSFQRRDEGVSRLRQLLLNADVVRSTERSALIEISENWAIEWNRSGSNAELATALLARMS